MEIEIIAFGPGLHMLREDTSPVKDRAKSMAENRPTVLFKVCGNTQANISKVEKKKVPLVAQASVAVRRRANRRAAGAGLELPTAV